MNLLDTADMHGAGHNEQLVGRAIRGRRSQVVLATKFGNMRGQNREFLGVNGKLQYVREACDASLKRLGVYYQHRVDSEVSIEDTVHELGIAFVPYSLLGRGFLTGSIRSLDDLDAGDWRRHNPRFQGEAFDANVRLADTVQAMAAERGCTAAQLALAWLLVQGPDIAPITGTRSIARLEENLGAVKLALGAADLDRLNRELPPGAAQGTRYPEAAMRALER